MAWNKEKELDKAVWVNQIALFLQSFCCTIELLANNIKLCRSCRYCSDFTLCGSILSFMPTKNIKNLWSSDVSKVHKKLKLTSTGLILVVYRNYNVLQSFCFENYWLGKETYISKIWNFKFRIFNSKLILRILWFHNLGTSWLGENVPIYSCEGLGLYTILSGWL